MANSHQVCVNTCQAGFLDNHVAAKVVIWLGRNWNQFYKTCCCHFVVCKFGNKVFPGVNLLPTFNALQQEFFERWEVSHIWVSQLWILWFVYRRFFHWTMPWVSLFQEPQPEVREYIEYFSHWTFLHFCNFSSTWKGQRGSKSTTLDLLAWKVWGKVVMPGLGSWQPLGPTETTRLLLPRRSHHHFHSAPAHSIIAQRRVLPVGSAPEDALSH